jgi:hypothetical protein
MRILIASRVLVTALFCSVAPVQLAAQPGADLNDPHNNSTTLCRSWVEAMLETKYEYGAYQKKNNENQCGFTGPAWTTTDPGALLQFCLASFREIYDGALGVAVDNCVRCRTRAAGVMAALQTDREWQCNLSSMVSDFTSSPDPAQKLYENCMDSFHSASYSKMEPFIKAVAACKKEKIRIQQIGVSVRIPVDPRQQRLKAGVRKSGAGVSDQAKPPIDRSRLVKPCGSVTKPCKPTSSSSSRILGPGLLDGGGGAGGAQGPASAGTAAPKFHPRGGGMPAGVR